ncbi:MAG: NAD(P)-dependent oxidoreductase [Saprospiraceae bacterium]
MKFGIIREGKVPPDARVPLNPVQCASILKDFDLELLVQPSPKRCFGDEEYQGLEIPMQEDISECDVLLGVKEVPIDQLIPNKTYLFFSHTIKAQVYNQPLLKAVVDKNIRLIDYEVLTDELGRRLIAFGKFAGMVGAHNGLLTYGLRTGAFDLQRMHKFKDYAEAKAAYTTMEWPPVKVVLTGNGRVANGAALVLKDMGIQQVSPKDFLAKDFTKAVFTQLSVKDYVAREDDTSFEIQQFFQNPQNYKSIFAPYTQRADIMINGIYWDNAAPAFFSKEEMAEPDWKIGVIADVTCDIAPVSSIPSTLRASTIADPFFAYDPKIHKEVAAFTKGAIDMMTIDNLPNELPRDASTAFGQQFIEHILPEFFKAESDILSRATVAQNGNLGPHFEYLRDYLNGVFQS